MFIKNSAGAASIAALLGLAVACSSTTNDNANGGNDAGDDLPARLDAAVKDSAAPTLDSGEEDASVPQDETVGLACTQNTDCEKIGEPDRGCSNTAFTAGTLAPSPVCIGTCTYDTARSEFLQFCDNDRGLCASNGNCFPLCAWQDGAAVEGCVGKNHCQPSGFGRNSEQKVVGLGVCLGGCIADADCTGGDKCQRDIGLCVKPANYKTYTKAVGEACTGRSDAACSCGAPATGPGYCVTSCATGATAEAAGGCPTGFTCSTGLPKMNEGQAFFTAQPNGLQGACRKTCTVDTDCAGGWCNDTFVEGNVCYPGARPAGG